MLVLSTVYGNPKTKKFRPQATINYWSCDRVEFSLVFEIAAGGKIDSFEKDYSNRKLNIGAICVVIKRLKDSFVNCVYGFVTFGKAELVEVYIPTEISAR